MTDRPILFSAPMVRALVAGRKSQHQIALKSQPPKWATFCQQPTMLSAAGNWGPSGLWRWSEDEQTPLRPLRQWPIDSEGHHYWLKPPIAPDDRLWVRETWKPHSTFEGSAPRDIPPTNIFYRADDRYAPSGSTWRASTQMPRWASRLTLRVVERLALEKGLMG